MKDTKGKYFLKYLYAHATGHASVLLDAIAPSIVLSVRVAGIALLFPLCYVMRRILVPTLQIYTKFP